MYKLIIDIGDWSWDEEQTVTIETGDFEKAQIIQEFIEFQKDNGWAADYELVEFEDEEDEEEAEEEELQVGDLIEDEDGLVWELVG